METRAFLELIFGDNTGYLIISTKDEHGNLTNNKGFKYPDALNTVDTYVKLRADEDIWFSPMLYSVPRRKAEMVSNTPVIYADTDLFDPAGFVIPPSINVITSQEPLKRHSYWVLDDTYSPQAVSTAARAIALTHAKKVNGVQAGVDPSGWDLSQLLRLPNSVNTKHEPAQPVTVEEANGSIYSLEEITAAYDPTNLEAPPRTVDEDMPTTLPNEADVLRKVTNDKHLAKMYAHNKAAGEDRSDLMYAFCSELFRSGFSAEEVLVVGWHAPFNKFREDGRSKEEFWKYDVSRAAVDPENRPRSTTERIAELESRESVPLPSAKELVTEFMTEEELAQVTRTWVDEYCDWVSDNTDAPRSYSVAGALTCLSATLGEWGYARPKYGEVPLGLFFIIMGETTKTRKSTSRRFMKRMLHATETEEFTYLLTSDVTPETLLDDLSERPNQSSVYDRDEAQQLIEDVKGGRGYMKGFFETLNDLYDGDARGRSRSTKKTKSAKVIFVQYLMGIRSQIQDNLELSDFGSGYLTRNIFIRGDSTGVEEMPEQGEPGPDYEFNRLSLALTAQRNYWQLKHGDRENKGPIFWDDEAWARLWKFKQELEAYIGKHPRAETLSAAVSRLYENTMRVATLLAMSRARDHVSMPDLYNALSYSMEWVENLILMVDGVTESMLQRDLDKIIRYLEQHGGLVTTSELLRWATKVEGWRKNQLQEYLDTLEDSETIQSVIDGAKKQCVELI